MEIKGKVALVTGAAKGIGAATSRALAKEGATVVVNYLTSERDAEHLAREIGGLAVHADVTNSRQVQVMVAEVMLKFKRIDILVNNVGIIENVKSHEEITEEMWERMLATNLKSAFNCTQAVAPAMLRQGSGKIINLASTAAFHGKFPGVHYNASKAGVVSLTKSYAVQLAPHVHVNAIAPGYIATKRYAEEELDRLLKGVPLKRLGRPEEIAEAVLFLIRNDYVTGHTLVVDGGLLAR